ncbi:DUF7282 domain-containing protein [Modestobacter lacusdianchii]
MTRLRAAVLLAPATVLVLSACGGGDEDGDPAPAVGTTFASDSAAASSATATGSAAATGEVADVAFEDQSGAGDSAVVARVVLPVAGFVVITADDGDDGTDDLLVGTVALPAGESTDVQVPLSPVLTEDTDLEATLYGDTDDSGTFDPAIDQQVPDSDDEGDDDGDDDGDVSEDADYDVR